MKDEKVGEVLCERCKTAVIRALRAGQGRCSQEDIEWALDWATDTQIMSDLLSLVLSGDVVISRGDGDEPLFRVAECHRAAADDAYEEN